MAYEVNIHPVSLVTAQDFTSSQFYVVDINSSGLAAIPTTPGAVAVGIMQDTPTSGVVGEVQPFGSPSISMAAAGAAFNNGAELMLDATGRLITATSGGHYVLARACAAAGAAGNIVPVLMIGPYYKA